MLDTILNEYAFDTENPILNYKLGLEYEKIGHTASAISFFLRAAERTEDSLLTYECLIRMGHCFDRQKNRAFTAKSMYRRAITVMPDRPEAYYFLCKFFAYESNYTDCYMLCKLALHTCKETHYNDLNVGYPGSWGMIYHEAISSWWYGKTHHAFKLFKLLRNRYWNQLDDYHKDSIKANLFNIETKLDIKKKKIVDCFTFYEPMKEILRLRLLMMKDYVDEFIISEANKTYSGVPLEYKLESLLEEMNLSDLNIRIVKVDIPEDDHLEIKEIDKINCGENISNINSLRARVRERMNIDSMTTLLDDYDDDTVFIVSDGDEIIKPESIDYISGIVRNYQSCMIRIPIVHLEVRADLRLYDKETNEPLPWFSPVMVTKAQLKKAMPSQMRSNVFNPFQVNFVAENGQIVQDLGWHFSSMGGKEMMKYKYKAFGHYDDVFNTSMINGKASSEEKMRFIDELKFEEGEAGPSAEKNRVLKKYPVENLPQIIFELPTVKAFLFPEIEQSSTKSDTKKIVEKLYPEYDAKYVIKYGNWGWCSLNKAGCFIDYVDEICNEFENPVCVEIGVYAGKSILPIALELKRHKKGKVYAVDPWTNEEATKGYDGINHEYWSNVNLGEIYNIYNSVIKESNVEEYVNTIVAASDDIPVIKHISFLHIDGQHTDQAIRDVRKFASQVSIGGYCVVDDVDWGEVRNAPSELEKLGFVHVHTVDSAMVFKKCCIRES